MIYTLTLNPAVDKTVYVSELKVNKLNRVKESHRDAGGKGINVSRVLKVLGTESVATGIIAGSTGKYIADEMDKAGISSEFMNISGETRTNLKIVDENRNLTEVNEPGPAVSREEQDKFVGDLIARVADGDVVVLSGSVTTNVDKDIYKTLTQALKGKKCKVILDADGELFREGVKAIPTLIKPNGFELCQYFGVDETDDTAVLVSLAEKLLATGIEYVVISLGGDGAIFLSEKGNFRTGALKVEVGSTVGAGDAMVAGLTKAIAEDYDYEDMIRIAVATSAGAVTTKGTGSADIDMIMDLVRQVKPVRI